MTTQAWLFLGMALGLVSFGPALLLYSWVKKQDDGTDRSRKIARAIKEGAWAYLRHLYSALAGVAVVFGIILAIVITCPLPS